MRGQTGLGTAVFLPMLQSNSKKLERERRQKQGRERRKGERESVNSVEFKLDFCQYSVNPLDLVNNI